MQKISIMIIGERLIIEAWAFLFQNGNRYEVVAECEMGKAAFSEALAKRPAIILILPNINLTVAEVSKILNTFKRDTPISKVIIISSGLNIYYVKGLIQAGALFAG